MMSRPLKNLAYCFTPTHKSSRILQVRSLEQYQTICVRSFLLAKGQQDFESINQSYSQDHPKKFHSSLS